MEQEACFSGYCRQMDQTRMVFCEYEEGQEGAALQSVDCCYPTCEFAAECPVADQMRKAFPDGKI